MLHHINVYIYCLLLQIRINIGCEVVSLVDLDGTRIAIPKELAEKLKKRAENSGFSSLSNYVTYILRQVMSNIKEKNKTISKEDEEKVKDKLRGMGYLE